MKNEIIHNKEYCNKNIISNDYINKDEKQKNNSLLMFEIMFNNKNKFTLDNHFDKNNCKIFLSDKEKYLCEIIIDDEEDFHKGEAIESKKTKTELLIPNGVATKYTFGQN